MRSDPVRVLTAGNIASTLQTSGIYLDQLYACSFHCIWTGGGAAGTLSVQGSNDNVLVTAGTNASAGVTNWTTLTAYGTAAVSGAGSVIFDIPYTGVRWVRVNFTATGGSAGSMTVNFNGKG